MNTGIQESQSAKTAGLAASSILDTAETTASVHEGDGCKRKDVTIDVGRGPGNDANFSMRQAI